MFKGGKAEKEGWGAEGSSKKESFWHLGWEVASVEKRESILGCKKKGKFGFLSGRERREVRF